MDAIKDESLVWLDKLEILKNLLRENPKPKSPELQKALKLGKSQVYDLRKINEIFDASAIEKVRKAANSNPSFILSSNCALALAGLKGRVGDQTSALHAALDLALSRRLIPVQIENLVNWIVDGKSIGEFDPSKAKRRAKVNHDLPQNLPSGGEPPNPKEEEELIQPNTPTLPGRTWGQRIGAAFDALVGTANSSPKASQHPKAAKKHHELKAAVKGTEKTGKWVARIFWYWSLRRLHRLFKWVAHQVVPLHQSHSFGHKQGERLASRSLGVGRSGLTNPVPMVLRWAVYSLCQLVFWWVVLGGLAARISPGLKPWVEYPFRFLVALVAVDFPAWVWRLAQEHLGLAIGLGLVLLFCLFGAFVQQPLRTALLIFLLGAVWFYGRGWGTEKLPKSGDSSQSTGDSSSYSANEYPALGGEKGEKVKVEKITSATSQTKDSKPLHLSTFKPVTKVVSSPSPKSVPQPWKAEDEDRSYLEAEMEAIPLPARIRIVTFQVDPMSADMSVKRLGDLRDPEKYSLIVGHDKQKVLSVAAAMTGLTLTYGDGLPIGGILGGPSTIEFYWEDVKAIHCDELKTKAKQLYQLGLVVNGLKKPFIVQCATPEGLRHLLSALEFWIGAATHAHPPISGMPYLSQGLRLDNSGKVAALWADSPGDLAVQLGDILWSLDSDSNQPQGKAYIEGALDSLTPGKHYLYVVTPEDWKSGPPPSNRRLARPFNPKRQKMELLVP